MSVSTKTLGNSDIKLSSLGLGCMGMSDFYGPRNDEESLSTLARSLELGVTFWDTADMYGPHTNEILVGKAMHQHRQKITLATKFGIMRHPETGQMIGFNGSADYARQACEGSLKRLKTDVIDLYYLHRVDSNTPIEETVSAMAELKAEGKIRAIGLSEVSVETLRRAHAISPISAVQSEYSLWSRDPEDGILQVCKELGVTFVPYSPLGRGFLAGQFKSPDDFAPDDYRKFSPRFQGENFQKNMQLVAKIEGMAQAKGVSASQLALAWVMAQGENLIPIPGTKRIKYLEENVAAADITFNVSELQAIEAIAPKGVAAGTRYPEASMHTVNR
jgi:aryl-alcohol dehydrogenase-like predicted oxidoreductase